MSLNPACWPDPQGMVDELRTLGIETMITHWPFMSKDSVQRAAYEAAGALAVNSSSGAADTFWSYLQEGALVTTLTDATRALVADSWTRGYGRFGVRAMWLDETEPDRTGPANDGLISGAWEYAGVAATEVGPTWRQQWLRTMTDTLRGLHGEGEYFLLSRSAWLGTAKYGHAVWSGDTESSWDGLQHQLPAGLGAGLSGIGLWTHDLGGYSATLQPFDPELEELLVRWAQLSSVSPLMRLHGHRAGGPPADPVCMQTNGDNEPWTLFKNATNYAAFVARIQWREQMRNYVMDAQAAWAATGAPMISPVWLLFPGDPVCAFTQDASDGACAGAFMCAWGGGGEGRARALFCWIRAPLPLLFLTLTPYTHSLAPPPRQPQLGRTGLQSPSSGTGRRASGCTCRSCPRGSTGRATLTSGTMGRGPLT